MCGDFNVTPESTVVEALFAAGMNYAHRDCAGIATCNSHRHASLIDYLFFDGPLLAKPFLPDPIDGNMCCLAMSSLPIFCLWLPGSTGWRNQT